VSGIAKDAAQERFFSDGLVGRWKALIAAIVVGFGAAVLTYKILRSG
jgi:hypothetical protein